MSTFHSSDLGRRGLLAGLGTAALVAGGTGVARAAEPPAPDARRRATVAKASAAGVVVPTIASPVRDGLVYRTLCEWDFSVETGTATRRFGGSGVYSAGSASSLWGTVEVPPGGLLDDVEFYALNSTTSTTYGAVWLWSSHDGYFPTRLANVPITADSALRAYRLAVPAEGRGPFPTGTKICATVYTPTDAKVQINGVRFGFRQSHGTTGLLTRPVRAYDSRSSAALAAGKARKVTLPETVVPSGVRGVVLNVTVTKASSAGWLKVYANGASAPGNANLYFPKSSSISTQVTTGVSAARALTLLASKKAHVVVDVVGLIS